MSLLVRFENRRIRITTESGEVFEGIAEFYPSGYGLHEFGRAEESLLIDGTYIFLSDIGKIELPSERAALHINARQFDDLIGALLEGPYYVADILPKRVPRDSAGQYFAVERYYLQQERIRALRRKFAEILLRLNCYFDMTVSFDSCESWEQNPDPEAFAERLIGLKGNDFLRAVFEAQHAMIDIEPDDTCMTVYDPDSGVTEILRALAAAEGLFVWSPSCDEEALV